MIINLKKSVKTISKIFLLFFILISFMNLQELATSKIININYSQIIKDNLNSVKEQSFSNQIIFQKMISTEIPINLDNKISVSKSNDNQTNANTSINTNTKDNNNNTINENNTELTIQEQPIQESLIQEQQNNIKVELRNLPTSIITNNNISENFNTTYGNVKIKNETNFILTNEILTPNIEFTNTKDIIIFHTHTCESYTQTNENSYIASGNFRTTNLDYSVAKVGSVLTDALTLKGYNVIHNLSLHDYPAYNGSYTRSFKTVSSILKEKPSTQLVIDLHRDAIGNMNNYAPCVKIGNEIVSQLMFVIGTNGGGLEHPNWQTNLKFAIKIQEKANELYPGLFRPIILRNSRYNQNLADCACIIEVGATGNTLEQSTRKYEIFSRNNI